MGDEGQSAQGAHSFCGRGEGGAGAAVRGGGAGVGMRGRHVRTPGGFGWRVPRERGDGITEGGAEKFPESEVVAGGVWVRWGGMWLGSDAEGEWAPFPRR
jgi:hypothetical protein